MEAHETVLYNRSVLSNEGSVRASTHVGRNWITEIRQVRRQYPPIPLSSALKTTTSFFADTPSTTAASRRPSSHCYAVGFDDRGDMLKGKRKTDARVS